MIAYDCVAPGHQCLQSENYGLTADNLSIDYRSLASQGGTD